MMPYADFKKALASAERDAKVELVYRLSDIHYLKNEYREALTLLDSIFMNMEYSIDERLNTIELLRQAERVMDKINVHLSELGEIIRHPRNSAQGLDLNEFENNLIYFRSRLKRPLLVPSSYYRDAFILRGQIYKKLGKEEQAVLNDYLTDNLITPKTEIPSLQSMAKWTFFKHADRVRKAGIIERYGVNRILCAFDEAGIF